MLVVIQCLYNDTIWIKQKRIKVAVVLFRTLKHCVSAHSSLDPPLQIEVLTVPYGTVPYRQLGYVSYDILLFNESLVLIYIHTYPKRTNTIILPLNNKYHSMYVSISIVYS